MTSKRFIALGAGILVLAIGGSAAPALAAGSATQSASNTAGSQVAGNTSSTTQGAGQTQSSTSACQAGCGGAGQAQDLSQASITAQAATSAANAQQNAVNANVPVTVSASGVSVGGGSATQVNTNTAKSSAANTAATTQSADQSQSSSSSCAAGCGGSGQAQDASQTAATIQHASSNADAHQNGVNANVPVTIAGGNVSGGSSSATQHNTNTADSSAANTASTNQSAGQHQSSSSSCVAGCGGSGQAQDASQKAATIQDASSKADAHQNGVNANVPVTVAGGDVHAGPSSASQTLDNTADSSATNTATTDQTANQSQSSTSSCIVGCGGSGQAQSASQAALTLQGAHSSADADQSGVNANVPVTVAGGDVWGGSSSADQMLSNTADSSATNTAHTTQAAGQSQTSSSSCIAGCGGAGQAQDLSQAALTLQDAHSSADADQNGVNADVPVTVAGGDVWGGATSASQHDTNAATSSADNTAGTYQAAGQSQSSSSGCLFGCGGSGQAQKADQAALTLQGAGSKADADQSGVNTAAPVSTGAWVAPGSASADQALTNDATSHASNTAHTSQTGDQSQSSSASCVAGCGGPGQAQELGQFALTGQLADSKADADQHGVNTATDPSGWTAANQRDSNTAMSSATNDALTGQWADQMQHSTAPGSGQAQDLLQAAATLQLAPSWAGAFQDATNAG